MSERYRALVVEQERLLAAMEAMEPADLAAWYTSFGQKYERGIRRAKERLTETMIAGGDLPGLTLEYSYEWPPEAAEEFPDLVRSLSITAEVADAGEFARLVDLVVEQAPEARVTTDRKLDGRRANQVILRGGQAGARLQELRAARPRLKVKV